MFFFFVKSEVVCSLTNSFFLFAPRRPTYGYAKMYSGVNTMTFVKHITSQKLTADGLKLLGDTVMRLAEVEGLEAHRNAVAIRLKDLEVDGEKN